MDVLKILMAGFNIAFGLWVLFRLKPVMIAAGLDTDNPKGIAEIQISWGALFIGLGIGAVWLNHPLVWQFFGIGALTAGIVRVGLGILNRQLWGRVYTIGLLSELLAGIIFILPI